MAKIYYKGRDYSRAIGGSGGGGGSVDSTDIPTAGKVSEFDDSAHINSEDMTSQEISDFLADINEKGTPSEYRKLLWTNASPSTTFAAQTISLDLSDYEEVEVEYVDHNVHISTMSQIRVKIGQSGSMNIMIGNSSYSSGVPFVANRRFSVTQTGITFGDGAGTPVSSSLATRNDSCIPYRIYGIKYEKVAPIQVDASDYVIEQGTSGIWTYRKWESGIAECWAATPATSKTVSTSYGAGYYAPRDNFILPSGLFTSISEAQASLRDANAIGTWFSLQTVSTTEIGGYIFSLTANTITVQLNIHAIGKWK